MRRPTAERALAWARLRYGSRTHVVEEERRAGFDTLDAAATAFARRFAEAGLPRGGVVALTIANRAADVAAVFGVWRAGGVLVPLDLRLGPDDAEAICARSGSRLRAHVADGELVLEPRKTERDPEDEGLAAIAWTSGTTGTAKGVEITHDAILWSAAAVMQTRRDTSDAVAAMVSPISHLPVFVSHYLARLLSGGTVVGARFDPERLVRLAAKEGVTDLPLVPAMVEPLLGQAGGGWAGRLRKVSVGSASTSMETKRLLAERFPDAEILEAYGQTESTDGLTMTVGREALERPGTVGRAHAIVVIDAVDSAGRRCAAGETGELVCQGPTLMRGYRDDPQATAEAFRGGWLHTGDLGRVDPEGFVYVTGRLREIVITGGENVAPEEVEQALRSHPAVAEAAVFGLPHPRWGEEVAAAVVPREPVSADALIEHVGRRLARFKRPRRIFFVDALPRTTVGKIRRRELRDRFADGG